MLMKGVVAYALGGTIVSAMLLGGVFTKEAQARTVSSKPDERAPQTRKGPKKGSKASVTKEADRSSRRTSPSHSHSQGQTTNKRRPQSDANLARDGVQKKRHMGKFSVTAYSYYRDARGGLSKTATGTLPQVGRTVAVDPRVIPLGSRVYIEGIGERIAEDTGGKVKGNKLDLFLPSVRECLQFGVRKYDVHLIARD